ncbi:hypothetical protein SEA_VERITY_13 [Gordonia phage Verity]|uniref:DUF1360 domain-containing protein n=2 Tax=Zitchvirus TaxID=2948963 RepID=A0A514DIR1_9CAUD|nr:hypothetical protein J1775_gp13 [Gordonia phage Zipp]YP_010002851.1 hypothetical protein J1776_gp13 [Gordonia phage Verity]QPO16856.1 hypothetical protein SEA_DELREY21_13 [Gordonia phage Delrey21]QXN74139.1 membrane protein [Gordonia phage DoctorFroggo]QDH93167.1 hypothetical protein SEA_ZIPP_13 [Gordonia phage Zipp]QDH93499.1 hypothetical protein SEA_VERITY_13 [Gordonia phage Verity]
MTATLDPLTTVLTILFIWRLTRLLIADAILERPRNAIVRKLGPDQWFAYLITCAWCSSVWIGAGVMVAAYFWADTRWWFIMVTAGAASLVAGVGTIWLDPADDDD